MATHYFGNLLERTRRQREADAQTFEELDDNLCVLCHAHGADKRSLLIKCGYNVKEAVPEALDLFLLRKEAIYYLRICKGCRASFLRALRTWREGRLALRPYAKDHDGHLLEAEEGEIPVRIDGAITMMTPAEYAEWREER